MGFIYAARDVKTGKLRSDLTNPRRKYWDRKGNAEKAINCYNKKKYNENKVELVVFQLVEVE